MSLLKKSSFSVGQLLWPFYIKFQCFCFSLFLKFYLSLPLVLFFLCNTYLLNNIIFFSTLWSFLFICLLYYLPTPKRIGKMYPCCSSTRELAREYNFIDRFFFFFWSPPYPYSLKQCLAQNKSSMCTVKLMIE